MWWWVCWSLGFVLLYFLCRFFFFVPVCFVCFVCFGSLRFSCWLSGWTIVLDAEGRKGFVPGNYLNMTNIVVEADGMWNEVHFFVLLCSSFSWFFFNFLSSVF
jgi:hypothetical protein